MAFRAIKHISEALRVNNWWNYKIPPLFGFAFCMIYIHNDPFHEGIVDLGLFLLWLLGAAGFGYYTNDVFDIGEDRKAGKENKSASHPGWLRLLISLALAALALAPWSLLSWQPLALALAGGHLLLFVLYSAPPIRLKERGFAGILADGAYAHAIPTAIILSSYLMRNESGHIELVFGLAIAWQWLVGLRNIFLHQWKTAGRDQVAGTQTWVLSKGKNSTQKIAALTLLPLELVALTGLLGLLALHFQNYFPGYLLLIILGIGICNALKYQYFYKTDLRLPRNLMHLLNDLYEEWLPALMLVFLWSKNGDYLLVVGIYFILFQSLWRRGVYDYKKIFGRTNEK